MHLLQRCPISVSSDLRHSFTLNNAIACLHRLTSLRLNELAFAPTAATLIPLKKLKRPILLHLAAESDFVDPC